MQNTRLLVLDDIYMMSKFANCEADESDQKGAQEQLAWLNSQLDSARKKGERVWVLAMCHQLSIPRLRLRTPSACVPVEMWKATYLQTRWRMR